MEGSGTDIRQFSNYWYEAKRRLHCLCSAIVECRCEQMSVPDPRIL